MKSKVYVSMATRLGISIILMVIILFAILIFPTIHYAKQEIVHAATNSTRIEINNTANQINNRLSRVEVAVVNAAWMIEERIEKKESLDFVLNALVENNPFIIGASIGFELNYFPEKDEYFIAHSSRRGDDIVYTEGSKRIGVNYYGMNWYIIPKLLKQNYWNDPAFDEGSTDVAVSNFSHPLYDEKGEVYAVLSAKISLHELTKWVEELTPFNNSYSFMVNQYGYYLTHPMSNQILNESIFSIALERENNGHYRIGKEMIEGKTGTILYDDTYATYTPISNTGWSICNICPKDVMTIGVDDFINNIFRYVLVVTLLIFISLYILIKRQLSPLIDFAKSAKDIANGDFDMALPRVKSNDEMLMLHNSFEYMQDSLKKHIAKLKETISTNQRIESELKIAHQKEDFERNLQLALEAGEVSAWIFDVKSETFAPLGNSFLLKTGILTLDYDNSIIHPDDIDIRNKLLYDIIEGREHQGHVVIRYQNSNLDGMYRYYDTSMFARLENDVVVTIAYAQKDITERYLNEQELEYSRKKTALAIDNAEVALIEYNVIEKKFTVNRNAINNLELMPHFYFDEFLKFIDVEDSSENEFLKIVSEMDNGLDKIHSIDIKIKINTPTGSEWMYCSIGAAPFERDINGKIIKYVGFIKDNTKWVLLNNMQIELNTQLKAVFNVGYMEPFIGKIKNNKLNITTPYKKENLFFCVIEDGTFDFDQLLSCLCVQDQKIMKTNFHNMLNGTVSHVQQELRFNVERLQNKVFEINMHVVVSTEFGVSLKFTGYLQDITERQQMILDLKKAKEEAEKLGKLKSAFLANMSHEIRTPLNAIIGFSELLVDEEDSETKSEYLNIIATNNELLLKLINDILDLSKIEAGFTEIKITQFDFSQFFNEMYASMQHRNTNPNVILSVINPYDKYIVNMDKNRLAQVCINYITNAIKYTAQGSIEMGYESVNNGIRIYVKDTGIGISDSKKDNVFQRFAKLDDFAQGTGLGMPITKAITEAMGGEVGFESEENVGSIFWSWIPCDDMYTHSSSSSCVEIALT